MKQVAIYCRVSTDTQELENQLKALRAFSERSGYSVYQEYSDIISGKELSRPAYDAMFKDAHKKLFDLVLFWDLSRFSRAGTLHTLQKLHELELLGIGYQSYQEQYLSSVGEFKEVVISIFATVAKIERQKISERTKAGLVGKVNVGKRGKDRKKRSRRGYFKA